MKDQPASGNRGMGLPKFDSAPMLILGTVVSFLLTGLNLWALFGQWHDAFVPYQLGKLIGAGIGIVLGIHCMDMIFYYRKHGRLQK